jgi:hypothetical protein
MTLYKGKQGQNSLAADSNIGGGWGKLNPDLPRFYPDEQLKPKKIFEPSG